MNVNAVHEGLTAEQFRSKSGCGGVTVVLALVLVVIVMASWHEVCKEVRE